MAKRCKFCDRQLDGSIEERTEHFLVQHIDEIPPQQFVSELIETRRRRLAQKAIAAFIQRLTDLGKHLEAKCLKDRFPELIPQSEKELLPSD